MRINELMSEHVHTVGPEESAERAWALMHTAGVRHLIVKDGSSILGVFSDGDAGGRWGASVRAGKSVGDLMDRHFASIGPDDTVKKAANLMNGRLASCLPVVRRGKLVGVVTRTDLLRVIGRGVDRPSHAARAATHYRVPHRRNGSAGRW